MNTKLKIGLWIGGVSLVGVGGFLLYKKFIKKSSIVPPTSSLPPVNYTKTTPKKDVVSNPPSTTEIKSIVIPFKNKSEGDAFRGYVNDNYSTYAREIDLDRSGSYNNSYIQKAWEKYGAEYSKKKPEVMQLVVEEINTKIAGTPVGNIVNKVLGEVGGTAPTTPFNASVYAQAILDSMKGWGTNEKKFFDTMDNINTTQRKEAETYFNQHLGNGETLEQWIMGEFSGKQLTKALTYIN